VELGSGVSGSDPVLPQSDLRVPWLICTSFHSTAEGFLRPSSGRCGQQQHGESGVVAWLSAARYRVATPPVSAWWLVALLLLHRLVVDGACFSSAMRLRVSGSSRRKAMPDMLSVLLMVASVDVVTSMEASC